MWVGTLLLVTICARSSKFGVTVSGLRSSAMNWDLWWELLITLNIWDAWMNRLTFVLRIKSTLLWRLSCLFTFPTKVDLSLVALCSAQSLVSACVRCVHLSKENHQLSRWAPEKSRYPPLNFTTSHESGSASPGDPHVTSQNLIKSWCWSLLLVWG